MDKILVRKSSMIPRLVLFFLFTTFAMAGWTSEQVSELADIPEAQPLPAPEILLIEKMGAQSTKERDDATIEIWKKGKKILPFLEEARHSDDPEIAERAKLLIPKIKYNVPYDRQSPIGNFIDTYSSSNNMERGEIFSAFMFRSDLSPQEASAAMELLIEFPPHEMEALPPQWALDIYLSVLERHTYSLLDEGKVNEAVNLWSKVELSPIIRRKYSAMLYNSDLSFNREQFPENIAKLIEADLALLSNDPVKAEELNTGEDDYITQRIASAKFDIKQRWNHLLNPLSTPENCPPNELPARWIFAKLDKDEETKKHIIQRLERIAAPSNEENPNTASKDDSPPDEYLLSPLDAARMLLAFGENKQGLSYATHQVWNIPSESSFANSIMICPSYPLFDIMQTGAREDSLPAILDVARKILTYPSGTRNNHPSLEDEDDFFNSGLSEEDTLKAQKLALLTSYLNSRGEALKIKPFIIEHINSVNGMQRDMLAFSYFSIFAPLDCVNLNFSLYEDLVSQKVLHSESIGQIEIFLTGSLTVVSEKQDQWYSLSDFIQTFTPATPLSQIEKFRRTLILTGELKGSPGERETLLGQSIAALKKLKNNEPEHAEYLAKVLVEKFQSTKEASFNDAFRFVEELNMAILPQERIPLYFEPSNIRIIFLHAPESVKEKYKNYFSSKLQFSKLFSPTAKPQKRERPETGDMPDGMSHYSPQITPESRYGEYLAAFMEQEGDTKEIQSLRKKTRLYAYSDNLMRRTASLLVGHPIQQAEEIIRLGSPSFSSNNESDIDLSYPSEVSAYVNLSMASDLMTAEKITEAQFLIDSTIITLLSPQNINTEHPTLLMYPHFYSLLTNSLAEKKKGDLKSSFKLLSKARESSYVFSLGVFYNFLKEHFPEERITWEPWYKEDKAAHLALLKKWPLYTKAATNLIEAILVMEENPKETSELISSLNNENTREILNDLALGIREMNSGNNEQARQVLVKSFLSRQSYRSPLIEYFIEKLSSPTRPSDQLTPDLPIGP